MYVVIASEVGFRYAWGDYFDGLGIYGPFETRAKAKAWIKANLPDENAFNTVIQKLTVKLLKTHREPK